MTDKEFLIRVRADIKQAQREMQRMTQEMKSQGQAADGTSRKVVRLGPAYARLAAAAAAYLTAGTAIRALKLADEYAQTEARLKRVTAAQGDYNRVSRELYEIAQRNGVAFRQTADLFTNINRSAQELGATRDQVLAVSDAVQQLGVLSGAGEVALGNALRQFSQAMAGGVLRAEEFNSIVENTPEIAARIAKGMDLTVGQLRLAVIEGRVLSQDVFNALLSQAPEIAREMEQVPDTLERASTRLSNSFQRFLGLINEATGASQALASVLSGVADAFDSIAGDSLEEVQAKLDRLNSGARRPGRTGELNRSGLRRRLEEQRQELLEAIPGIQGIDATLTRIEDELRAAQTRQAEIEAQIGAIPEDQRKTKTGTGRSKRLTPFGRLNRELELTNAELEQLSAEREKLLDELFALDVERTTSTEPVQQPAVNKEVERAGRDRLNRIQSIIEGLQQEAATYGQSAEQIALYRLELDGATAAQLAKARAAIAEIESQRAADAATQAAIESAKKQAETAARQNAEMAQQARRWQDLLNPINEYQRQIEEIETLYAAGAISAETYAEATFYIQDALERLGEKTKKTKEEMSEFAAQAARNIESKLGETLYNVMDSSFQGILLSWVDMLRRMASEALAARLAESLLGKDFAKSGDIGGWIGSFMQSFAVAHTGGIVGQPTGQARVVSPLLFANAPRYHTGGLPGLMPGEVPIIAQKGEEILSRNDPRNSMNGGGSGGGAGVRIVNVIDPDLVQDYMSSASGEEAILNVLSRRRGDVQSIIG